MTVVNKQAVATATSVLKAAGWDEDAEGNLIRPVPEATFGFTVQVTGYGDDPEADATTHLLRALGRNSHTGRYTAVLVNGEKIWPRS